MGQRDMRTVPFGKGGWVILVVWKGSIGGETWHDERKPAMQCVRGSSAGRRSSATSETSHDAPEGQKRRAVSAEHQEPGCLKAPAEEGQTSEEEVQAVKEGGTWRGTGTSRQWRGLEDNLSFMKNSLQHLQFSFCLPSGITLTPRPLEMIMPKYLTQSWD